MRLLLDDKQHHGCDLNANEACIFAAILKCTRAGRGWYGNYRELAAAMPFVMSRQTASRAVDKLLTLGLIEVRENETLWAIITEQTSVQNGRQTVQNGQTSVQNGRQTVQNGLPPNNPPIYNNMNEKEKEQPRALRTHDGEEQQDCLFEKFWNLYEPAPEFHNRYGATKFAFEQRSEVAQREMIASLEEHPGMKGSPNPYFFVVDFPEPKPVFLRGDEAEDIVQVRYNGAYKLCTRATMELFGLEWVRDW